MPSVLVTGANRGLGLEFVRQYAAEGWRVYAGCRAPADADALRTLADAAAERLSIHALDVQDRTSIQRLVAELADQPIDLLINNAAIWGSAQQLLGGLDDRIWAEVLDVDVVGPVRVTEAFLENVAASARRTVVMLSSRLGSIASNDSGGRLMYRAAKAGLNAVAKSLAVDLAPRGIVCIALSPGWVRTEMGGPGAPLSVTESVTGMRQVIERLDSSQSGSFLHYDGSIMPW